MLLCVLRCSWKDSALCAFLTKLDLFPLVIIQSAAGTVSTPYIHQSSSLFKRPNFPICWTCPLRGQKPSCYCLSWLNECVFMAYMAHSCYPVNLAITGHGAPSTGRLNSNHKVTRENRCYLPADLDADEWPKDGRKAGQEDGWSPLFPAGRKEGARRVCWVIHRLALSFPGLLSSCLLAKPSD